MENKNLEINNQEEVKEKVSDVKIFGNTDCFKLLCKASSNKQGWMKSTKVLNTYNGCLVQVSTQQKGDTGDYSCAEALSFIPNVNINNDKHNPKLIPINTDVPEEIKEKILQEYAEDLYEEFNQIIRIEGKITMKDVRDVLEL